MEAEAAKYIGAGLACRVTSLVSICQVRFATRQQPKVSSQTSFSALP